MPSRTSSFGIIGIDAVPVTIEVDTGRGLPSMTIVGLPDNAVRESRERVRAAMRNAGFAFPQGRITVNLAPADMKKEGPAFDLAIAIGLLAATGVIPSATVEAFGLLGELSLDGSLRPVSGTLAAALACTERPWRGLIVPEANAREAALAGTVAIFPFPDLGAVAAFLKDGGITAPFTAGPPIPVTQPEESMDIRDVKAQQRAKRAMEVAAAGGHNILLIGPPGGGKSMLARRFPGLLPPMSRKEQLDVTRVHSAAAGTGSLAQERPFRAPHHTCSRTALIGGGSDPRPGEISMAHHGVLFLDELPEFPRGTLESLRQPLEDGSVTVARAARTLSFPAQFTLVAAMNPCPCGHALGSRRPCRCPAPEAARYLQRVSGPLLERIDIHITLPALEARELSAAPDGESSAQVRARVASARARQDARTASGISTLNARLSSRGISRYCLLDEKCRSLLQQAVERLGLSARSHDKVLRVARTIADLAGKEQISQEHLAEAVGYRELDRIGG